MKGRGKKTMWRRGTKSHRPLKGLWLLPLCVGWMKSHWRLAKQRRTVSLGLLCGEESVEEWGSKRPVRRQWH